MENVIAQAFLPTVVVLVISGIIALMSGALDWSLERQIDEVHLQGRSWYVRHLAWAVVLVVALFLFWLQSFIREQEAEIGTATATLFVLGGALMLLLAAEAQFIAYIWRFKKLRKFFRRGQPESTQRHL